VISLGVYKAITLDIELFSEMVNIGDWTC